MLGGKRAAVKRRGVADGGTPLSALLGQCVDQNGYRRQDAVERLGATADPAALPALLERANDWVPQVRAAAVRALDRLMIDANAGAFIASLPAVYRLRDRRRGDHAPLIRSVERFLVREANRPGVVAAVTAPDPAIARAAFTLCADHALHPLPRLIAAGLAYGDVVVRGRAAALIARLSGTERQRACEAALSDRFMPIRRTAFRLCQDNGHERGLAVAERLLFDPHATLRGLAARRLADAGDDVAARYAAALGDANGAASTLRCALWGVAELRHDASLGRVRALGRHTLPSVRKAALQAQVRLAGDAADAALLRGLLDPSSGVVKESARLLQRSNVTLDACDLLRLASRARGRQTLPSLLLVARRANKWERLGFLLALLRFGLTDGVAAELQHWFATFNRSGAQPDADQIAALGNLLPLCAAQLSPGLRSAIAPAIKPFGLVVADVDP